MKKHVHSEIRNAVITCQCGNTAELGAAKEALFTETCSACHPFYTGAKKMVARDGRVARFMTKYGTKR